MPHPSRVFAGIEVVPLCDATGPLGPALRRPLAETFPGASPADWAGLDKTDWVLHFHSYLLRDPAGRTILVDTGIGGHDSPAAGWAPVPGNLLAELAAAGVGAEDVDVVVLTHLHADHAGGAVVDGAPAFPNARYLVQRADLDWVRGPVLDTVVRPLGDTVDPIDGPAELSEAISIVPTPGHQSVAVGRLMLSGDALVHPVQLANPSVRYAHDEDAERAADTRRALLERAGTLGTAHLAEPFTDLSTGVDLEGVPETLLWNLYQRAAEAARPDAVLADPKAVELVDSIDYPFEERFGRAGLGQWQALRALRFDQEIRGFLDRHPGGQVVALGEGLETQFWRVDNGRVRWLGVDLPETVELRRRLLPDEPPRRRTVAGSALDDDWMGQADPGDGLLLSAQGLLMYFQPEEVHRLIAACAQRFPGATLLFDGVPPWFSKRTIEGRMKTAQGYQAPPMPWAVDAAEKDRIRAIPGVVELRDLTPPRGRGALYGFAFPLLNRVRAVRELGVTGLPIMAVRFAG